MPPVALQVFVPPPFAPHRMALSQHLTHTKVTRPQNRQISPRYAARPPVPDEENDRHQQGNWEGLKVTYLMFEGQLSLGLQRQPAPDQQAQQRRMWDVQPPQAGQVPERPVQLDPPSTPYQVPTRTRSPESGGCRVIRGRAGPRTARHSQRCIC